MARSSATVRQAPHVWARNSGIEREEFLGDGHGVIGAPTQYFFACFDVGSDAGLADPLPSLVSDSTAMSPAGALLG